jgi:hypothetical protein
MGYHKNKITRGTYGEFSKVQEEFDELKDGVEQGDRILQLVELTDLLCAIRGFAETQMGFTLDELVEFSKKTTSAFEDGSRK